MPQEKTDVKEPFSAEGHIVRFYYKKSDDFHVALFIYSGKQAVITGNLYSLEEKEKVNIQGEWFEHPKFGRQVKVTSWERPVPSTKEQAVAFLSSGLVKGVGPVMGRMIVEKLGADAVKTIMEKGAEALAGIKGLRKVHEICKSIRDTYEVQRVISQLLPFGISANTAIRAHKKFGGATAELVKRNPYCLMEVDKIAFLKADAIAQKLGVPLDSMGRIAGAIKHTIDESIWNNGHCFLIMDELIKGAMKLLNHKGQHVTVEQVSSVVKHLAGSGKLVIEAGAVYPPRLYRAEVALAEKVKSMISARKNTVLLGKIERFIKQYELREGIRLADEQKQAVVSLMSRNLLVLTGGPGVGKTTSVKAVIGVYEMLYPNEEILLASPTGKASRRLSEVTGKEASTTHRLLGFSPEMPGPTYNKDNTLPCGLLVVDEFSMSGVTMAKLIFDAVSAGTRVLLVGDADQLPSVEPGNVLKDLLAAGVPSVRLEKVFRQASQSQIITGAHKINSGQAFYPDQSRGDFYFIEKESPDEIARMIVGCVSRLLKLGYTMDDIQVLSPMKNGPVGTIMLNRLLQERLNPAKTGKREIVRGDTAFRVCDRVICIRNNYEKGETGVFNGETGIVNRMQKDQDGEITSLVVQFDQGEVEYSKKELYDLELAYAITAHKSQGSEFKAVVLPLTTSHYVMLARKLIYTAVTRAKERVVLVGTKKAYWVAVKNDKLSARNTRLAERIRDVAFLDVWAPGEERHQGQKVV